MSVLVAGNVLKTVAKQVLPCAAAQKKNGKDCAVLVGPFLEQRSLEGSRVPREGGRLQSLPSSRPAQDRANPSHSALLKIVESFSTTT